MNTFADIIEAFGGTAPFGEAIGIEDSHARVMKARNSIPDTYWRRTVDAASQRQIDGVTLEAFAALAEARIKKNAELTQ